MITELTKRIAGLAGMPNAIKSLPPLGPCPYPEGGLTAARLIKARGVCGLVGRSLGLLLGVNVRWPFANFCPKRCAIGLRKYSRILLVRLQNKVLICLTAA
jgi:hypothetical protein